MAQQANRASGMDDDTGDGAAGHGASGGGGNGAGEHATGGGSETPVEQRFTHIHVLGHAGWLISRSPEYRHLFINDLEWLVMPPVALNQFRLWRTGNVPQAFASWAWVGPAQAARLEAGIRRLSPGEWKSGGDLWVIDLIAPFGGREAALEDLRTRAFGGRPFRVAPQPGGGGTGGAGGGSEW